MDVTRGDAVICCHFNPMYTVTYFTVVPCLVLCGKSQSFFFPSSRRTPELCRFHSMKDSLSSPLCFKNRDFQALSNLGARKPKSGCVVGGWLSVRGDSAPSTLTSEPTKRDPCLHVGPLSISVSQSCNSVIQIDRMDEEWNRSDGGPRGLGGGGGGERGSAGGFRNYDQPWNCFHPLLPSFSRG